MTKPTRILLVVLVSVSLVSVAAAGSAVAHDPGKPAHAGNASAQGGGGPDVVNAGPSVVISGQSTVEVCDQEDFAEDISGSADGSGNTQDCEFNA